MQLTLSVTGVVDAVVSVIAGMTVDVVVMIVVAAVRGSVIFAVAYQDREIVSAFWESRQNSTSIDYKDLVRRVALSHDDLLSPKTPGTLRIVSFGYLVSYGSFLP